MRVSVCVCLSMSLLPSLSLCICSLFVHMQVCARVCSFVYLIFGMRMLYLFPCGQFVIICVHVCVYLSVYEVIWCVRVCFLRVVAAKEGMHVAAARITAVVREKEMVL